MVIGIMVDTKWNVEQAIWPLGKQDNSILGCIRKNVASKLMRLLFPCTQH